MRFIKIIVKLIGLFLILLAIIGNPFIIIKQPPSFVEFDNLIYIKIFIVFAELLFLSIGFVCFFKPGQVIRKIQSRNLIFLYRHKKKEVALLSVSCIFCLIALEFLSRLLFAHVNELPINYSAEEMIYPALYQIKQNYTYEGVNILLLGGSVLYRNAKTLQKLGDSHSFDFYNAAFIAHTSRDSLYKYQYLAREKLKFDYVIFYHGINDVRLNNIPEKFYKEDYSHYYYYKLVNQAFDAKKSATDIFLSSTLAYNSYHLFCKIYSLTIFRKREFVPYDIPVPELTEYGDQIKTVKSFRSNLNRIINLSKPQKAILIVPYFAFQATSVDHDMTRIWGKPQNVVKGIKRHNAVVAQIQDDLMTIDTDEISADISNFEDICHLTDQGKHKFATLLISKIMACQKSFQMPATDD